MKKRITLLVTIFILSCLLCCCGNSSNAGQTEAKNTGLFSGVGGWKTEEGIIILLDDGGTGSMLSEVKIEGDASNLNIPSVYKTEITWSEDDETVTIKAAETEYVFQKKKDGENEALELSGYTYARLDEDALKEYKEKAESAVATGGQPQEAADSRNEEIVPDEPITIIDNDMVTVNVTKFFREVFNEGTNYEYVNAGFEIEADNKTDKYELDIYPRDCSLSDRRVIEFAIYGNNNVAPGKIATMKFIKTENEDFENLESLYELEGNLDVRVIDGNQVISDLGGKYEFSIPRTMNTEAAAEEPEEGEAAAGENAEEDTSSELSEEEIDEQLQGEWVLNAGSGGVFSFDDGIMTVESNGMTLTGTYEVNIEDSTIDGHFTSNEGKKVTIHMPFKIDENGDLVLMNNANVPLDKV